MATATTTKTLLRQRTAGSVVTLPPSYDDHEAIPLGTLTPGSSTTSLPDYETIAGSSSSTPPTFQPTASFQIEALGHGLIALPMPPKPVPINIYTVDTLDNPLDREPAYRSLRAERRSGTCTLHRGDDPEAVCTTTYRCGPCKPPVIQLRSETLEVKSVGIRTRAQDVNTRWGVFRWRYGSRSEKKDAGADSLLVFERVVGERRVRVAQLVRNAEMRAQGSSRSSAGNGGRLMCDLKEWEKSDREEMEALVVSSAVCMLKKEVDRRRTYQAMAIAGGGGGGGG